VICFIAMQLLTLLLMAAELSDDPNPSRLYFRKMYKTYYIDWYQMAPYNNKSIEFRFFFEK
jgi:hypothetical protein